MPRRSPPIQTIPSTEGGTLISLDESLLPRSIVSRLAKGALPDGTMIQKDAVLAILKSATVFVGRLCDEANAKAKASGKKTIVPKDILDAVKGLEFEEFIPRMEKELKQYEHKISLKRAKKSSGDAAGAGGSKDETEGPPTKKARRETNGDAAVAENGADEEPNDLDDADLDQDDEEDIEEEEEEDDEEEVVEDDTIDQEVLEDVDPAEEEKDEALDNGYDSD